MTQFSPGATPIPNGGRVTGGPAHLYIQWDDGTEFDVTRASDAEDPFTKSILASFLAAGYIRKLPDPANANQVLVYLAKMDRLDDSWGDILDEMQQAAPGIYRGLVAALTADQYAELNRRRDLRGRKVNPTWGPFASDEPIPEHLMDRFRSQRPRPVHPTMVDRPC